MNINDNNNIEKPLDSIHEREGYTKNEKSPSKIKAFAQSVLNKNEPLSNASETILHRLKELLSNADKMAPNKNLQTKITALNALENSENALDIALRSDKRISARLSEIAKKKLSASPNQQCRQLSDMEQYLTLLSNHANDSDAFRDMTDDEKKQLTTLVEKVREAVESFYQAANPNWTTHLDKLDALIKEELLQEDTWPSMESFLNTHRGVKINEKTFTHIFLESLIKNSSLEGNNPSLVLDYLQNILESKKDNYRNMESFPALLKMFNDAVFHINSYSVENGKNINNFHTSLTKLVKELKADEKTLIPIGWTTTQSGHTMEMGIEKKTDGSLQVVIYNLGEGINEYHPCLTQGGIDLYQPFIRLSEIQEDKLLSIEFSQALFELLTCKITPGDGGEETHYGANDVYGIILNSLGGKQEPCQGQQETFMLPQSRGTCTWSSPLAVFHTNLSTKDYYQIISDIYMDGICTYYQQVKDEIETREVPRIQLQHAVVSCTQIALESFQNKGISLKRLQAIYSTLKELQSILEAAEGQSTYNSIPDEELVFKKLEAVNPQKIRVKAWAADTNIFSKKLSLSPSDYKDKIDPPIIFSFDWINDPLLIEKGLSQLLIHLQNCSRIEVKRCLEIFFQMQARNGIEEIWNKIPVEELSAVTVMLVDISEQLLYNVVSTQQLKYTSYAYYVSALLVLLSKRNPELKKFVAKNGIPYEDFSRSVTASLLGSPTEDQNLYTPEDRFLRKKALEILESQELKIGNYLDLTSEKEVTLGYSYGPKPFTECEAVYIYRQFENNSSLKNKLIELYPDNKDLKYSTKQQVEYGLNDWYGKIMPAAFCALRRQNLIAGLLCKRKGFYSFENSKIETTSSFEKERLKIKLSKKLANTEILTDHSQSTIFKELVEIRKIQNIRGHIQSKKKSEWTSFNDRNYFETEKQVMLESSNDWEKNLKLILTQGDMNEYQQSSEQQVIKTISYFSTNMNKLTSHEMRMLCRFLLFEESHLEKILEKNPASSELHLHFVKKGFEYFVERKNISGTCFFIQMMRNLEAIFLFSKKVYNLDIRTSFGEVKTLCESLLSTKKWSNNECTLIHHEIAANYVSHHKALFTKDDAISLLTALIYIEVFPIEYYKTTLHSRYEIQEVFSKYSGNIEKLMKGADGSSICHAILQIFSTSADFQPWDCTTHYPLCISKDGSNMIDLKKLMIYSKDIAIRSIPRRILEKKEFKNLFSKKDYIARQLDWQIYEFIDERGIPTIIKEDKDKVKINQKFSDGYWYQSNSMEINFPISLGFKKLLENSTLWMPLEIEAPQRIIVKDASYNTTHTIPFKRGTSNPNLSIDEQNNLHKFLTDSSRETEGVKIKFFMDFDYKVLLKDISRFKSFELIALERQYKKFETPISEYGTSEYDKQYANFMKQALNNPELSVLHKLFLNAENSRPLLDTCQKVNGPQSPWYLIDMKNTPNRQVKQLFEEGMLWKDEKGILKELELPSLNLSFKMKQKQDGIYAYSVEHPKFFVSSNQRYRGLKEVQGAIVLENKSGNRKLILPYGKINPSEGSFTTSFNISIDATKSNIAYDLDNVSRPIANSQEQKLYLAFILLAQKKYEEAQNLIRTAFSKIHLLNSKEIDLLNQISGLINENSPHASAVMCTALALLETYQRVQINDTSAIKNEALNILIEQAERYLDYKTLIGVIPHLKLTAEEEKKVLGYMIGGCKFLQKHAQSNNSIYQLDNYLYKLIGHLYRLDKSSKDTITLPSNLKKISNIKTYLTTLYVPIESKSKDNLLITRPKAYFLKNFLWYYDLALKDPFKLEIYLSAAEQDKEYVPEDIVQLLRSVAYCTKNSERLKFKDFPPTRDALNHIILKFKEGEYTKIMNRAREIASDNIEVAQAPITVKGTSQVYPRPVEAQKIQTRLADPSLTIDAAKTPQRRELLTAKQLELDDVAASSSEKAFFLSPNFGLQLNSEEIFKLQLAITGTDKNACSAAALECSNHISTYWNMPKHANMWHNLKPENLPYIKKLLLVEQVEMGKQLNRLKHELLGYANSLPSDIQEALMFEMEKMGNIRQPITLKDIIIFTARAGNFTLVGKNQTLALHEKELLEKSIVFFDATALQQQLGRAIDTINDLEKILGSREATEKISIEDYAAYSRLSEKCYQELTRKLPYAPHEHPELLLYEVLEEIGLHDWQVKDLKRMLRPKNDENPNIILEKVMGSGKTKVYLPLLALSKADGEYIPFIVVHSSQYESVATAIQIKSGQNFSQIAHALNFSRESDTSLNALQKILDECLTVQKQRQFFVVTDKSMHSLSLAFKELWDTYLNNEKEDSSLGVRIEKMREILNLIKTKGKAILDEADLLLNCRFEVIYSLGDRKAIPKDHSDAVADLYKSIKPILMTDLTPFTTKEYIAKKPDLINAYIDQIFVSQFSNCDKSMVFDYLNGGKSGAEYVDNLPEKLKNLLAIAFYEFNTLLPIVLARSCNVDFGYSDNPDKILPVPYLASDVPSPTSEFSFPYTLLDYAIQTLESDGVTATLLQRLIQDIQSLAEKELQHDPSLTLTQTQAYQAFYDLCGKNTSSAVSIPFHDVMESDIVKLVKMYKEDPPDIYEFAKKYITPAVTLYPRKLTSTPFTLETMFYEKQGFTGTPYNSATYPNSMETIRDVNSAGKTEGIIWKNSQTVHLLGTDNFKASIETIHKIQKDGEYHAFIDTGAIFNGSDNQTVAADFLEYLPSSIKGVVFFKDNQACVLERGRKDPILLAPNRNTEKLYIFYDQWHTTGTDLRIAGKSLMSVGRNTKKRDLEQGYMRDRQAGEGNRVEFILSKDTTDFIQKVLELPESKKIGTAEIQRFTQVNQDLELNEQLMMASFAGIQGKLSKHLHVLLLNNSTPPNKIYEKRKIIRDLIAETITDSPYNDFGRFQEELPAKEFFSNIIDKTAEQIEVFLASDLYPLKFTLQELKEELWSCIDLSLLPEKISGNSNKNPNQVMEQQNQQEVKQERLALVNKELLSDVESKNRDAPYHWNFNPSLKTFSSSFYRVIDLATLSKEMIINKNFPEPQKNTPFISLSAIFAADDSLKEFSDIFTIEVSYNFLPVNGFMKDYNNMKEIISLQSKPFAQGQLDVKNILICKELSTAEIQVRLLSQADAGFFFNHLTERPTMGKREVDATLYHLSLKTYQSNNEAIATGKENAVVGPVLGKIVQAKFFNGESIYTKEESVYLSEWIKDKGQKRMERLFMDHILPSKKEDKQQEYSGSILSKLFSA